MILGFHDHVLQRTFGLWQRAGGAHPKAGQPGGASVHIQLQGKIQRHNGEKASLGGHGWKLKEHGKKKDPIFQGKISFCNRKLTCPSKILVQHNQPFTEQQL